MQEGSYLRQELTFQEAVRTVSQTAQGKENSFVAARC